MATLTTKVPLEVIESIIDCLSTIDNESFSSLKACSLVSRNLLPRARKHIFNSVTINGFHNWHEPRRFVRLMEEAPDIAECVASLDYTITMGDFGVVNFGSALSRLTRLKSLTISNPVLSWKDLPFEATILNLMHLSTLTHLKVARGNGFHLSDLTLCANLKSLEMDYLGPVEVGGDIEIYQKQPPTLESYTYNGGNHCLLRSLCTTRRTDGKLIVDISGLKKLSLHVNSKEADAIEKLFALCTRLTHVFLFGCEHLLVTTGLASLFLHSTSIQTLRYIHISLGFHVSHDAFQLLVSEFASLTGETVIETIQISIDVTEDVNGGYLVNDTWCALDQVFNQSNSGWRKLRTFSIDIVVHVYYSDSEEEGEGEDLGRGDSLKKYFLKLPHTLLRGIASNEVVRFDFNASLVDAW